VQVFFTHEPAGVVRELIEAEGQQRLILHHTLPSGEAVAIRTWEHLWTEGDAIMEASLGQPDDFVFPGRAQPGLARPVRLTVFFQPDEMRCVELSGYKVPAGEAVRLFPNAGRFSRTKILNRS